MGNYVVVQTAETDEKGMVKEPGQINGGFYKKTEDPSSHAPSVAIAVEDIHAAMKRVTENGGTLAGSGPEGGMEPAEIPGVGLWMSVYDTEGNRVSILQPAGRM